MAHSIEQIPIKLRRWFGSDGVVGFLGDLNDRLKLEDEDMTIIPYYIYALLSQNLRPQEFVTELSSSLNLGVAAAQSLAREIREKIFDPIKNDLFEWGVDISAIDTRPQSGVNIPAMAAKMTAQEADLPPKSVSGPMPAPLIQNSQTTKQREVQNVRVAEQTDKRAQTIPAQVKIAEALTPTMTPAQVRTKDASATGPYSQTFPVGKLVPSVAENTAQDTAGKREAALPPVKQKIEKGLAPALKEKEDVITLKEEMPFMLHKETSSFDLQPIPQPSASFRTYPQTQQAAKSPSIPVRIESAASEMRAPAPAFRSPTPAKPANTIPRFTPPANRSTTEVGISSNTVVRVSPKQSLPTPLIKPQSAQFESKGVRQPVQQSGTPQAARDNNAGNKLPTSPLKNPEHAPEKKNTAEISGNTVDLRT